MDHQTKAKLISYPFFYIISLIAMTNKHERYGRDLFPIVIQKKQAFIFACWHSRLLIPLYFYGHGGVATLISQSKDGEYISQVAQRFGLKVVRGSSSRRGVGALKGLIHILQQNNSVLITPDGPRGPRECLQMGVIHLAKATGLPITPVSFSCTRHKRASSWDRFMIPLPFGKMVTVVGDDIHIPKDTDTDILEQKRLEVQDGIRKATKLADEMTGTKVLGFE